MAVDRSDRKVRKRIESIALLALWLAISIVPSLMLLAASFNETALFRSPLDLLLLKDSTLANYTAAFTQGDIRPFLKNSVIISALAVDSSTGWRRRVGAELTLEGSGNVAAASPAQ